MARTALTINQLTRAGVRVDDAPAANVDGHSLANTGNELVFLYVNNASAGQITITFKTNKKVAGITLPNETATLDAAQSELYGPFPKDPFNQSDGTIHVDFSAVTSVTCKAFSIAL
ncbi:MAG: hypothetical protein L0332_06860 [Chloroflexi bacterium]|nr:hypothetical protein [Chloroflexota bacterium]